MHKTKTIVDKFKKDNNKINQLIRKKTYDPKNIINLDTDISEMDTHIKNYPTIQKKNSNLTVVHKILILRKIVPMMIKNVVLLKLLQSNLMEKHVESLNR